MLLVLGAAGALALIVADLSTLYRVNVGAVVLARVSGQSQHDFALLLLGLVALPMLYGALRGALPAMLAVAAIGLAAVFAGPVGDRDAVGSAGSIGDEYAGASAHAGAGYRLETVGSVLLLLAGGGLLVLELRGGRLAPALARLARPRRGAGDEQEGSGDGGGPARRRLAPNPYADDEPA